MDRTRRRALLFTGRLLLLLLADSFSIATAAARTTGGRFTVAPSPYDR